jgi:hypothetical protein
VLNLSDNLMSRQPMEALTEAIAQGRPPLAEVCMGNLGVRSGKQIQRFLQVLRSVDAPLRTLDLHGNCLLPSMGAGVDPQAWLSSMPGDNDFRAWCNTALGALAEVCSWMETPGNVLTKLVLNQTMEEPAADDESAINSLTGALLAAIRDLAVRRLCDALSSEHCVLLELSLQVCNSHVTVM